MNLRDSKIKTVIPTESMKGRKPEETRAPGNTGGINWEMRETPGIYWIHKHLREHWYVLVSKPDWTRACPETIVLNPSELMKGKECRKQYYSLSVCSFCFLFLYEQSYCRCVCYHKSNQTIFGRRQTRNYKLLFISPKVTITSLLPCDKVHWTD